MLLAISIIFNHRHAQRDLKLYTTTFNTTQYYAYHHIFSGTGSSYYGRILISMEI